MYPAPIPAQHPWLSTPHQGGAFATNVEPIQTHIVITRVHSG